MSAQVSQWPKYEPSAEEEKTVAALQVLGAPQEVYYIDRGAEATAPASKGYHEIWFFNGEKEYHGESSSIVKYPQLAYTEMKSSGVIV